MDYEPIRFDPPAPPVEREMYSRIEPHGSMLETDVDDDDNDDDSEDGANNDQR